jgi:tRNA A37 methylthiotransferase MiaB
VGYDMAFLYAYSLRDRTHAAHKMEDDVPQEVKARRLQELINTWRAEV